MEVYGALWGSMGLYGGSMGLYGGLWNLYGALWGLMGAMGSPWESKGTLLRSMGSLWGTMGSLWVPMSHHRQWGAHPRPYKWGGERGGEIWGLWGSRGVYGALWDSMGYPCSSMEL